MLFLWPYHILPRKIMSLLFATWQMCVLYICKTGKADYAVACNLAKHIINWHTESLLSANGWLLMCHMTSPSCLCLYLDNWCCRWCCLVPHNGFMCHKTHIIIRFDYYIKNYIANASCTKMSIFAVKYTKLHTAAFL